MSPGRPTKRRKVNTMAVLDLQALETSAAETQLPGSTLSIDC